MLLACSTIGAAASLAVASDSLGAATTATGRCTTGALTVAPNLSSGTIVSVTVGGLPSACGGATLQAAVNNGSASATGSTAVPAGGGAVTVTLSSAPSLVAADQIDIVLVGP